MTDPAILERALWLICQIPELHELSYEMGKLGDDACPASQRHMFRRGQAIMAEVTALAVEIEAVIAARTTAARDAECAPLAAVP